MQKAWQPNAPLDPSLDPRSNKKKVIKETGGNDEILLCYCILNVLMLNSLDVVMILQIFRRMFCKKLCAEVVRHKVSSCLELSNGSAKKKEKSTQMYLR